MKKFFLSLAVFVMALCANAQTNQYFWYNGNLMMGNPIAQIDSVTFGEGEPADTLHIMLPRTIIKTVHDTVYITIHDTICPDTEHNGFRYVDLGLSVMWADANVGAENPEDYGNYYCWAETSPREYFNFYEYNYGGYTTMTKYNTTDGLTRLLKEDDAASANMGGKWRIPTNEEWNELISMCQLSLDTVNSHPGLRYTASNGNSIFIPRAGGMWFSENNVLNSRVYYWSADVYNQACENAYSFSNNLQSDRYALEPSNRTFGCSVRGVFSK